MIGFKPGVRSDKCQADCVAGAVALFSDNQLCLIAFIRVGLGPFLIAAVHNGFTVQEHNDIGVLFNAAGLAEVTGTGVYGPSHFVAGASGVPHADGGERLLRIVP